jgi:putative transposase
VPWKEMCPMDEKLRFIVQVRESEESFAELCRQFGISRKTGYKWVERYEARGAVGLTTRPPVARECRHRMPTATLDRLIALRKDHPTWGPKKLRARLVALEEKDVPAASTIGDALKKHGLIRPRRRRAYPPHQHQHLAETQAPNDTWCVDFKGHFACGDARCHPLTITDHFSRYLLKCEALTSPDELSVKPHFERAFREFGLPMRIRSDNGAPFATAAVGGLSSLSVWWIKLGITPEHIDPGEPQQNGRHERMHRTLGEDAVSPASSSVDQQQRVFDRWRCIYNDDRPHEALEMKAPTKVYQVSRRRMTETLRSPEYPSSMRVSQADSAGRIRLWGGKNKVLLSPLLAHEPIGLESIGQDTWRIFYGPVVQTGTLGNRIDREPG